MRLVRHGLSVIVILFAAVGACSPKKRAVAPRLPPAAKPADLGAPDPADTGSRVTFALSRPLSREQVIRAFDTSVMKLLTVETQADGPNWKKLISVGTGLDLRGICLQGGALSVLVDKANEDRLEPTAQGVIFSLSGPEDARGCDQHKEYCTLSIVAGEGGQFHLRVAELALQEGPFVAGVAFEEALDQETWVAVLDFTPREGCLDGDGTRTHDDESAPTPVVTMAQVVFSFRGVPKVIHEGVQSITDPAGESTMEAWIRVHHVPGKDPEPGFHLLTVVETRNPGNREETSCAKIDQDGNLAELGDEDRAALKADPELEAYDCANGVNSTGGAGGR
jgi:hypothetical protein